MSHFKKDNILTLSHNRATELDIIPLAATSVATRNERKTAASSYTRATMLLWIIYTVRHQQQQQQQQLQAHSIVALLTSAASRIYISRIQFQCNVLNEGWQAGRLLHRNRALLRVTMETCKRLYSSDKAQVWDSSKICFRPEKKFVIPK